MKYLVTILMGIGLLSTSLLHAQASDALKKQFMDIMLGFPSRFTTIKGSVLTNFGSDTTFYAKVKIAGTKYCSLEKNEITGNLEYKAIIMADDDISYDEFKKAFQSWKTNIASLDFNGATLVPYTSIKYAGNDMYAETAAWRLNNEKNDIDKDYASFTIWLQLLDLDQGGFMLQVLVSDY